MESQGSEDKQTPPWGLPHPHPTLDMSGRRLPRCTGHQANALRPHGHLGPGAKPVLISPRGAQSLCRQTSPFPACALVSRQTDIQTAAAGSPRLADLPRNDEKIDKYDKYSVCGRLWRSGFKPGQRHSSGKGLSLPPQGPNHGGQGRQARALKSRTSGEAGPGASPSEASPYLMDSHISTGILCQYNAQPFYVGLCTVCTKKLIKKRKKLNEHCF